MDTLRQCAFESAERGFTVLPFSLIAIGFLAVAGVAIDIGHIYVAKTELQTYVDEAAIAASFELDGTSGGIARARSVVANGPAGPSNSWNFDRNPVTGATASFSKLPAGPFEANPSTYADYRFVRAQVTQSVTLYLLPVLGSVAAARTVAASATAGQSTIDKLGDGLSPFSPTAHNNADPNFGFTIGAQYTLRWAPSGQRKESDGMCAGDAGFDPNSDGDRGYVDVGQGTGASNVDAVIINNDFFLPMPLEIGSSLGMISGNKSVPDAIDARFNQDTDRTSSTYSGYSGTGRRILVTPINDGGSSPKVVGFAAFFLPPNACGSKNNTPCCAEYIGPAVYSSKHRGASSGGGLFLVQLVD
jgi:Flp pilus assembly protein TadG